MDNSQSPFVSNVEGVHFKEGDVEAGDRRVSSPISTNSDATSKKKKSSNEDEFELQTKKSISLRNRKLSFGGLSIKVIIIFPLASLGGLFHSMYYKRMIN